MTKNAKQAATQTGPGTRGGTAPIGACRFDSDAGTLTDAEGRPVALRPQSARVLGELVAARGSVVTKDALMAAVWPGTFVTDDSLVQCVSEIRKALGPRDARLLATVPKQGYRLAPPPRSAAPGGAGAAGAAPRPRRRARALVALAAVLLLAAALGARSYFGRAPAPGSAQSVAVMPFENLGADETYAYYASGLAEDLGVSLAKVPDLAVVSRSTAAGVAAKDRDPREIARRLGVRYVVDGSVRRVGGRLRLTASLIDGATGETAWADTYDGGIDDIFAFQDAVLNEVVRGLSIRLSPAERRRIGTRGTANVAAFDAYLRGLELQSFTNKPSNAAAIEAFSEAVRQDPGYATAYAYLSLMYSMAAEYNWAADPEASMAKAGAFARKGVEIDPTLPFARFALGRYLSRGQIRQTQAALTEFDEAIRLDPNYVDAYAFKANVLVFAGRAEDGLGTIRMAMARNPSPPFWYFVPLGIANYHTGDYEAARDALTTALERNPNSPHSMRFLIATYGRLGEIGEAEWIAAEYETLGHVATVSEMTRGLAISDPTYVADFAKGLRMAGIPE